MNEKVKSQKNKNKNEVEVKKKKKLFVCQINIEMSSIQVLSII